MSGPRARCRSRILLAAVLAAPAWATGGHDDARHSLRAPVTGESFYFVMADRFENGRTDNDTGLPRGQPRATASTRPAPAGTTAAT